MNAVHSSCLSDAMSLSNHDAANNCNSTWVFSESAGKHPIGFTGSPVELRECVHACARAHARRTEFVVLHFKVKKGKDTYLENLQRFLL